MGKIFDDIKQLATGLCSKEPPPAQPCVMENVHKALMNGNKLHAFRSGGGLRVVRVGKDGNLLGYGEHPYIEEALRHCDEDIAAGGRDYHYVYGKLYDHYYTGSSSPSSDLDKWILSGGTFDVVYENGKFVASLSQLEQVTTPKDVMDRVLSTGKAENYTVLGLTYEASLSHFGNGKKCVSCRCLDVVTGRDAWFWDSVRTGESSTMMEALYCGLRAEPRRK